MCRRIVAGQHEYIIQREALIRKLSQQNSKLLVQHTPDVVKLTQQLMTVQLGQNSSVSATNAPISSTIKPKTAVGSGFGSTITSTQSDGPPSLLDSKSEQPGEDTTMQQCIRRRTEILLVKGVDHQCE